MNYPVSFGANLELCRVLVLVLSYFLLLLHVIITFVKNIFIPLYHIMNVVYALGRGLSNVFVTCVQSLYVLM